MDLFDWISDEVGIVLIGILVAALLGGFVWEAIREKKEWDQFSAAHDCVEIGEVQDMLLPMNGIDGKGNMTFGTIYNPGTVTYRCNDGKTYTRSK